MVAHKKAQYDQQMRKEFRFMKALKMFIRSWDYTEDVHEEVKQN